MKITLAGQYKVSFYEKVRRALRRLFGHQRYYDFPLNMQTRAAFVDGLCDGDRNAKARREVSVSYAKIVKQEVDGRV